jgi:hypothetical protein
MVILQKDQNTSKCVKLKTKKKLNSNFNQIVSNDCQESWFLQIYNFEIYERNNGNKISKSVSSQRLPFTYFSYVLW